jgi:predicted small lipoprotein YifL
MKAVRHAMGSLLVISLLMLVGCGQKGPLTLPKQPVATQQSAPVPAEPITPATTETQG